MTHLDPQSVLEEVMKTGALWKWSNIKARSRDGLKGLILYVAVALILWIPGFVLRFIFFIPLSVFSSWDINPSILYGVASILSFVVLLPLIGSITKFLIPFLWSCAELFPEEHWKYENLMKRSNATRMPMQDSP